MHPFLRRLAALAIALLTISCHRPAPLEQAPLLQRGYLWQRNWTPAVMDAIRETENYLDGVVVLAGEIVWESGAPRVIRANISWESLQHLQNPCALALRVAPYPGPFSADDRAARAIADAVRSILHDSQTHGITPLEFQLDFDCAQKKLAGYRLWLRGLQGVVHPSKFVITTLPAWLDEPEFRALVGDVDGYVLQVHSVPTLPESGQAALCDPALARRWVAKAEALDHPFAVALPTYTCLAGYDATGKLLGLSMDSVQPAWPPGTNILEFKTNANDLAALVAEWKSARPRGLRELLWYRVPVASDARNWRWPTLTAVMAGRAPRSALHPVQEGAELVDISLVNDGEADEALDREVIATWHAPTAFVAGDALAGWTLQTTAQCAIFTPLAGRRTRLAPGEKRPIGWLRYDRPASVELALRAKGSP